MGKPTFRDPSLTLSRIYTRRGDLGETRLANGRQIRKDDLRIEAYGTVDELNAFVGAARETAREQDDNEAVSRLAEILLRVQHELFNLGSAMAVDLDDMRPSQPRVTAGDVAQLEAEIDEMNVELGKLPSFTLAGGCRLNAELHVCRTVCRRAERAAIRLGKDEQLAPQSVEYLNRLSDAFFVWGRWASLKLGAEETLWEPNLSASGRQEQG